MNDVDHGLMLDLFNMQEQVERAVIKMQLALTASCDHPLAFVKFGDIDTTLQTCRVCKAFRRGYEVWTKATP